MATPVIARRPLAAVAIQKTTAAFVAAAGFGEHRGGAASRHQFLKELPMPQGLPANAAKYLFSAYGAASGLDSGGTSKPMAITKNWIGVLR